MERNELKILDSQFVGGTPTPGAKLTPVDLFGTGESVGDFSLRAGEDGEAVLMLTVDKQYLEDSFKVWTSPVEK